MTIQTFTPELCAHLSSLAPGFGGHTTGEGYDADGSSLLNMRQYYVDSKDHGIMVVCGHRIKWGEDKDELKVICPAWQVEDVLRNLKIICANKCPVSLIVGHRIVELLAGYPDTAYQKIEEYLWTILK